MKQIVKDHFIYQKIKNSGLFDPIFYYSAYDDVRLAETDPLWHYIKFGWKEGRNPSDNFNTNFYLEQYADVKRDGINPLYHYLKYGLREQRLPVASLDMPHPNNQKSEEVQIKRFLDASIIVPVFNAIQYTQACYSALCTTCGKLDVEFIFVDNASTDSTSEWLDQIGQQDARVLIIHNKENRGFSGAVNQGIVISSGKFIALVNNDTVPGVGWLENLIEEMNKDLRYGILSPYTNYVGEGLQIDDGARNLPVRDVDDYSR
ncbi:MAG: glycosyltransferase, partial [Anaerolineaceae bacterium]